MKICAICCRKIRWRGCDQGQCGAGSPTMTNSKVQLLEDRANHSCEYCRKRLLDEAWEVEHIIPRSRGTNDSTENLAVACHRCNSNKGDRVSARDPVTGLQVRLYDPRRDRWDEHFTMSAGQTVGQTPIGRATAALLFRRTSQHLPPDLRWEPIRQIQDENLYYYLNRQHARRLSNQFEQLEQALRGSTIIELVECLSPIHKRQALFAAELLRSEMHFTRSNYADISAGIEVVSRALRPLAQSPGEKREVNRAWSILLQQLATTKALQGDYRKARSIQTQAAKTHELTSNPDRIQLEHRLRYVTMLTKYSVSDDPLYVCGELCTAVEHAQEGRLQAITYLADAELRHRRPSPSAEKLLLAVDDILNSCGYGQDFDFTRGIILRRRWWALKLILAEECDLDLLAADIVLWRSTQVANEIREFELSLRTLPPRVPHHPVNEMLEVVRLSKKRGS